MDGVSTSQHLAPSASTTENQWVYASAALVAITTLVLVILAVTHQPLGIVGYSLFGGFDALCLVAFAISYYNKKNAPPREAISPSEERPIVPEKVQECGSFQSSARLREGIGPFFPILKGILKTVLRDYYGDNRDLPAINEAVDILAHQIDGILADKKQLFDLILFAQTASQQNQATVRNLLAQNRSNESFSRRLHEAFEGPLRDIIQQAAQSHRVDEELDNLIGKLRRCSDAAKSREFESQDNLEDYATSSQCKLIRWLSYSGKQKEYEVALSEVVSYLLRDQWENHFNTCFQAFADPQTVAAISTFLTRIEPILNNLNGHENAMRWMNDLYNGIAAAPARADAVRAMGNFLGVILPQLQGNMGDLLVWGDELAQVLPNDNQGEEGQPPLSLPQRLHDAYQPGGLLNRPAVQNLFKKIQWPGGKRIALCGINNAINKQMDLLPLTPARGHEIGRALKLMMPDLFDPIYHGTIDQNHRFRERIKHIISLPSQ